MPAIEKNKIIILKAKRGFDLPTVTKSANVRVRPEVNELSRQLITDQIPALITI